MAAAHHERGQLLELPGRLRGLAEQRHLLAARYLLPILFLVHDKRVGGEAEQADHFGVAGRSQQHDRIALVDQALDLALFLDHPRARSVNDVEVAGFGPGEHLGANAVGSNDDGRALCDFVERIARLDPLQLQLGDHTLVVDDLAERVRPLAGRRRFLGLVDRLADSIAEPCAPGDANLSNVTHCA